MKLKRLSLLLLCLCLAVATVALCTSCKDKTCKNGHDFGAYSVTTPATCTADGVETRTCSKCDAAETRSITAAGHSYGDWKTTKAATCTAEGIETRICSKCSACEDRALSTIAHTFNQQVATATYQATDATCLTKATYYYSCSCGTRGTATFEAGEFGEHRYELDTCVLCHTTRDHVHSLTHYGAQDKTCTANGNLEYWTCYCGKIFSDAEGQNQTTVQAVTIAMSHDLVTTRTLEPTCAANGLDTITCKNCSYTNTASVDYLGHAWNVNRSCKAGNHCTRTDCDACNPAEGHNYVATVHPASCLVDGYTEHTCSRCSDTYNDTFVTALGHDVDYPDTPDSVDVKGTETLHSVAHYVGTCSVCEEEVTKDVEITTHNYVKTITAKATCQTNGTYTYTCACGYSYTENFADATAHKFDGGTTAGNVTTFTCQNDGCSHTKTAIVAGTTAEATAEDLKNVDEVKMTEAAMKIDPALLEANEGKSISLGAEKKEASEVADTLSKEEQEILGENPVFEFTMTADGDPVDFDGNKITVRIPYELGEDEDPESIVIFWIGDEGLVAQNARYEEGFAVFDAEHFSYYTVTRLDAAQRCVIYGHIVEDLSKAATCYSDGLTYKVCTRCGETLEKEFLPKQSHDYEETSSSAATCTEAGSKTFTCQNDNCTATYTVTVAAIGHHFVADSSEQATCQKAGYTVYKCDNENCTETYKAILSQKTHNFVAEEHAASCTEAGYTKYTCKDCQYSYLGNEKNALGHNYIATIVAHTCTEDGYTLHACSRCDSQYTTDVVKAAHVWDIPAPTCGRGQICLVCHQAGAPATGNHTMENGICSVCGEGCVHEFTDRVVDPTCLDRGYTERTCSKCGLVEKTDYTAALGHTGDLKCDRCGLLTVSEKYVGNFIRSLTEETFTIRLTDVKADLASIVHAEADVNVSFFELYIELTENGTVCGHAAGSAEVNGTAATAKAVIEDNVAYLVISGLNNVANAFSGGNNYNDYNCRMLGIDNGSYVINDKNDEICFMLSLDAVLDSVEGGAEVKQLLTVLPDVKDQLFPKLLEIVDANAVDTTAILLPLLQKFCSATVSGDEITLALDFDKVLAFNAELAEKPVKAVIIDLYGRDVYNKIVDFVLATRYMTVQDVLDLLESRGFVADDLLALGNELADEIAMAMIHEHATLEDLLELPAGTFDSYLKNEDFLKTKLVELPEATEEDVDAAYEQIAAIFEMLETATVYDLVGSLMPQQKIEEQPMEDCYGDDDLLVVYADLSDLLVVYADPSDDGEDVTVDSPEDDGEAFASALAEQIAAAIETVRNFGTVKTVTKTSGEFVSFEVKAEVPFGPETVYKATVSVVAGSETSVDYQQFASEIKVTMQKLQEADLCTAVYNALVLESENSDTFSNVRYNPTAGTVSYTRTTYNGSSAIPMVMSEYDWYHVEQYLIWEATVDVRTILASYYVKDCSDNLLLGAELKETRTYRKSEYVVYDPYLNIITDLTSHEKSAIDSFFSGKTYVYNSLLSFSLSVRFNPSTEEIGLLDGGFSPLDTEECSLHQYEYEDITEATGCLDVGTVRCTCSVCGDSYTVNYCNGHRNIKLVYGETEDCEKGVRIQAYCDDCKQYLFDDTVSEHVVFMTELEIPDGCCADHRIEYYSCPCGQDQQLLLRNCTAGIVNYSEEIDYCSDCGLALVIKEGDDTVQGCRIYESAVYYVARISLDFLKEHDDFSLSDLTEEDAEIYYSGDLCRLCGYSHQDLQTISTVFEGASCDDGVTRTYHCYACGEEWEEFSRWHENTHTVVYGEVADCSDGYTVYEVCDDCGETVGESDSDYHEHICETEISLPADVKQSVCPEHRLYVISCPCGKEQYIDVSETDEYFFCQGDEHEMSGYLCTECGIGSFSKTYYQDVREGCQFYHYTVYTAFRVDPSVIPEEICEFNPLDLPEEYYTELYRCVSKRESYTSHTAERVVNFSLKSESCDDGAYLECVCEACGESWTVACYYHRTFLQETIDLAEYGCRCGGSLLLYGCACGQQKNCGIDAECEFDYVDQVSLTIDNGATVDYSVYTCCVTDPACAFSYAVGNYSIPEAENPCCFNHYESYLLGYCVEDESYERRIDRIRYSYTAHQYEKTNYETTDLGDGAYATSETRECPCGNRVTEVVYYDASSHVTQSESHETNVSSDMQYCETIRRYEYTYQGGKRVSETGDFWKKYWNGTSYGEHYYYLTKGNRWLVSYKTETYYDENGEQEWGTRYDYEYDETGCNYSVTVTYSDGQEEVRNGTNHSYSWTVEKYPTCTQYGYETSYCYYCKKTTGSSRKVPYGHDWCYQNGQYVCSRCGLENANGADGNIVLEDLSEEYGDSSDYVAGFYAKIGNDFAFENYVWLVPTDSSREQILVNVPLRFTYAEDGDEVTAVYISREDVANAAAEYCPTVEAYFVKLVFTPIYYQDDLEYAIVFTDGRELPTGPSDGCFLVMCGEEVLGGEFPESELNGNISCYRNFYRNVEVDYEKRIVWVSGVLRNVQFDVYGYLENVGVYGMEGGFYTDDETLEIIEQLSENYDVEWKFNEEKNAYFIACTLRNYKIDVVYNGEVLTTYEETSRQEAASRMNLLYYAFGNCTAFTEPVDCDAITQNIRADVYTDYVSLIETYTTLISIDGEALAPETMTYRTIALDLILPWVEEGKTFSFEVNHPESTYILTLSTEEFYECFLYEDGVYVGRACLT